LLAKGLVDGLRPSHPDVDRAWALFVEHGVSPVFHVGSTAGMLVGRAWTENDPWPAMPLLPLMLMGMDVKLVLADLILNGVFERHPELRVGVMELGVKWVAEMIERMDNTVRVYSELTGGELAPLSELPSETLRRRVTFGAFSHEAKEFATELADVLMYSGDYPHPEGLANSVAEYRAIVGPLAADVDAALYGGNAAKLIRPG
jgi:predicted TIM-barrel fold metal-dependent hydrolase